MPEMDDFMNEKMFGQKGPVKAQIQVDAKPQFDYAKEVAAAKGPYQKLLATLNVGASSSSGSLMSAAPATPRPVATSGELQFTIGRIEDSRSTKDYSKNLNLQLVITGNSLSQSKGLRRLTVSKALDDTGGDLMKEDTFRNEDGLQFKSIF